MCICIQLQIHTQTPHPMALHSHYFPTPIHTGSLSHACSCTERILCMNVDSVCAAEHMDPHIRTPLISENAHSVWILQVPEAQNLPPNLLKHREPACVPPIFMGTIFFPTSLGHL